MARRRLNRKSPQPLALEPRLMFDGAAVDTAAAAAASVKAAQDVAAHPAARTFAEPPVAHVTVEPVRTATATSNPAAPTITTASATAGFDIVTSASDRDGAMSGECTVAGPRQLTAGDPAADGGRHEVAFVDSSIDGWTQLADSIGPGIEVVLIDGHDDGIRQIADYLQGRTGLDAIHIIAHGQEAQAKFGSIELNASNIAEHSADLARVGAALGSNGDLLLYGCDIGKGADGMSFIGKLADATGADVEASSNSTGSASLGGDWVLEARTGSVEVRSFDLSRAQMPDFLLGSPAVTSVDDMTYTEGSGAVIVDNNISITGGTSYDGKSIRFSLTNGQTTDTLGLTSASNVNAAGAISLSGSSVYLGNGSGRDIIGTVDSTENGLNGQALKINFVSTFTNSSFESGLTGWTAMNQMIDLGSTSIAGFVSPTDPTNPANAGGNDNDVPTTLGTMATAAEAGQSTDGTKSAHLSSTGMTTRNGYDVVHGPAIYSDVFSASAGDAIYFDWRALAGSDAYDVYGYLLNTTTGATTEVLNATGTSSSGTTNWATASASIPTSGNYRFVFVSGTYDYSGGKAAGASLYIDNVRVYGSKVNDTVVTNIARQVTFASSADNAVTSPERVFTVTATSSTNVSGSDTGIIHVTATNDAPTLTGTAQVLNYTENAAATPIDTVMVVADPDGPASLNGGFFQAQITSNGAAEDQLSVLNQGTTAGKIGVSGSSVTYGGTVIGTIDATLNGVNGAALKIALNSNATVAATQALARVISYSNSSESPSVAARTVTFTLDDGGNTGTGGALQGTRTATINVAAVDDPAVLTLSNTASNYTENDNSYFVDPNLTLTDVDNTTMNGAKVVIGSGFNSAQDALSPASGTNSDGITYSYDSTKGVLTLSGSATVAQYQAALRAVKYSNSSDNPDTTPRAITFTLGNTVSLTINGINHYYELVAGPLSWTAAKTAAEGRTFQGLTGYLATITSQSENDFIRQKLTADAWIGASDDFNYINAATGTTTYANQAAAEGHWYWVTGPEKGTRISDGNASPVTFAGSYAYWNSGEPNNSGGNEHYGEIYSSGATGRWNDLPNSSTLAYVVEYSDAGGTPTFSKSITVTPVRVNDAPVTSGSVTVPSITEDAVNNSGSLVSSFATATDPDGDAVTGVAITGSNQSRGTWQYSTDNGATWTNVGSVSGSSALLLRTTDRVRFIPDGLNSDSASLVYKAWDRTNENGVSIKAGVKVDVSTAGGITAYSTGTQTANLTVTAINDAPVLAADSPVLSGIDENAVANGGQLVSSILGATVTDSDSAAQQGIAVTTLTSGNGTWEYSTDGGSTWSAVGTVAANNALLLRSTDYIRFRPDGNNGTNASFSYKAWDRTSGTQGTKVNASTGGGTTAFSNASNTASISVSSVNDAPVLSGAALTFSGITEKDTSNSGQTVATLLGGTITDVDLGAMQGVAIVGSTVAGTGHWEYDSGSGWTTLGAVTSNAAMLLRATDKVRFVPDGYQGGSATLTLRGWDQTSGTAGTTADVSTNGGTAAFSAATATATISVTEINDAPTFTAAPSGVSYTERAAATTVGGGLTLIDDGTNLVSASVRISAGFTAGDTLAVGTPGGLTVSYNSATGVLTLTGTASVATYQAALASVTFASASDDPTINSTTRTLQWRAVDTANLVSTAATNTITVIATADAPVISSAPASWSYTEDDGTRVIAPAITLSDADDTNLSGATVTVSGSGYLNDGREVLAANTTGTNITASFDGNTGVLTLTGTDSVANYQRVLRSVTYTNTADYNNPANVVNNVTLDGSSNTRNFAWQVTDANSDGAAGAPTFGAQSSIVGNTSVTIFNANETPQVTNVNGNVAHIGYTEGGSPATLEGVLSVLDDSGVVGGSTSISSAFVRITQGLAYGDELGFFNSAALSSAGWTQSGTALSGTLDNGAGTVLSYSFSLASGDLQLTTTTGAALKEDYTAVMQLVGYRSTSDDPTSAAGTRTLIWRVTDSFGEESAVTAAQSTIIDITAVNDAPTVSGLPANGDIVFTENGSDIVLAPSLSLADPDDTYIGSATIALSGSGFINSIEYLGLPGASITAGSDWTLSNVGGTGVNASYDWASGTLTLSGNATLSAYESVLRTVTYGSIDNNPTLIANTRTLTWTVTDTFGSRLTDADGGGNDADSGSASSPVTSTITLIPVNDAPLLAGLGGTVSYTEGGSAVPLAGAMTLADSDDSNLSSARVWIGAGFTAGDTLSVGTPGGLSVSYDSSTGVLTLSGSASKATYRTALRTVRFSSTSSDPTAIAASRSISWEITDANASGDGALSSSVGTTHVNLTATDNAASVSGLPAGGSIVFTENGSAVTVAPSLVLSDADDTQLAGVTVSISSGATAGDLLSLGASLSGTGISLDPSSTSTSIVLTGVASLSDYQSVVRSIVFSSSSDNPAGTSSTRTLTWSTTSAFASRLTDASGANDSTAGVTTANAGTSQVSITSTNDAPGIQFDDGTPLDTTDSPVFEQGGAPLYVVKATNPNTFGGVTVSDIDDAQLSGATVQVTDSYSSSDVLSVGTPPGWSKVGNVYSIGGDSITVSYNSGTGTLTLTGAASKANYSTLLGYVQFYNGTSSPTATGASRELTWTITDANSSGDGAKSATGKTYLVIRDLNDAPQIAPATSSVTYTEGVASVTLPTITITDPDPGEIVTATLTLSSTAAGRLTTPAGATYDSTTGVWTYTGTVANANAALAAVTFVPATDNDVNATISLNVSDGGEDGAVAATGVINLNVTAVNDAPVLTPISPVLPTINENDVSNSGYLVSSFRGPVADVDTGAQSGIAITSLTSGNGTWQYSTDGGVTWTNVGTVSATNALLLRDSDLIRFVPDGQNGTAASFDYRAWDRSSGTAGTKVDASNTVSSAPFSSTSDTASLTVTSVNDAPVLSDGDTVLPPITEDQTTEPGYLVSDLLVGKVTDVDAGAQQGIAVTGLNAGNGTWQFSQDGGTTWTNVTNASSSAALLLSGTDRIRFVPNGRNATSASFDYRAWDRSSGTSGGTADTTAAGAAAAFSTEQNTVQLNATAVNDAPVLSLASPTLTPIDENAISNGGQTVASFLGTNVSDVDNGALTGIAITSLNGGNGGWQYSLDGGTSWLNVGNVSSAAALLLRSTDLVRFVPDGQNATSATLSYRAWDQSAGTAGTSANVGAGGGTTAFSSDENTSSISVSAVNDAPTMTSDSPTLPTITEDDVDNAGVTISGLLGTTVSDVDAGSIQGIAITGLDAGNGTWQYSLDNGATWVNAGSVSTDSALLLRSTDRVRFKPDGNNATTASFNYRAWDQSSGTAGSHGNATTTGGSTAFSSTENTAGVTVTSVNDAPVNDVRPTFSGGARSDGTLRQDGVITLDRGVWHDVDVEDPTLTYTYQWQIADDAAGTNLRDIAGATSLDYKITAGDIGKFIRVKVTTSDRATQVVAASDYTQVTNHTPVSNVALVTRETTESVPLQFTVPTDAFVDADGEDTLYYSATLADGSPLPAWLTFDPVTRTFSGTPGGGDVGVLSVRVTVGDHGQATTFSDFTLRVMSVPVNLPEDGHVPPPLPPASDLNASRAVVEPSRPEPAFIRMPETQQLSVGSVDAISSTLSQAREVSLRLVRPLDDQQLKPAEAVKFTVPPGTFVHSNSTESITLYAQRVDGTPLPTWLHFNPATGQFEGTPPDDFSGDIDVRVTARDSSGRQAETVFRLHVQKKGEKPSFKGKPPLSKALQSQSLAPASAGAR